MGVTAAEFNELAANLTKLEGDLTLMSRNYSEALDTIWMMLAAALVFFMHAGFSMLEAGCVRFKNTQNILAKNLVVVTVGFLAWWSFGNGFAFGITSSHNKFAGSTNFFMYGFWDDKSNFRKWLFQGAFCATGGTIVSGAMAERTQLKGFLVFIILMTTIIYPMIVYWAWSGEGFLNYTGDDGSKKSFIGPAVIDFAGSGIIHLTGGIGALAGSLLVGPRNGRWDDDKADAFDGHSIPFCVLGTFFLWFGWYGFNPGSTTSMKTAGDGYTAALVACNTTLAPSVAGLLVFFLRAQVVAPKCLDVGGFCNGILAGLVAITAGCSVVRPWEAIVIGIVGGLVYQGASMLLKRLHIDDVVDAVPVHMANGMWGLLAVGLFGDPADGIGGNGLFFGGDQLGTQVVVTLLIVLWTGALSTLVFLPLRKAGMLRLGDEFQSKGADKMEHTPHNAYSTA